MIHLQFVSNEASSYPHTSGDGRGCGSGFGRDHGHRSTGDLEFSVKFVLDPRWGSEGGEGKASGAGGLIGYGKGTGSVGGGYSDGKGGGFGAGAGRGFVRGGGRGFGEGAGRGDPSGSGVGLLSTGNQE